MYNRPISNFEIYLWGIKKIKLVVWAIKSVCRVVNMSSHKATKTALNTIKKCGLDSSGPDMVVVKCRPIVKH